LPCGWYRVRGQPPSTGGRDHTHTHSRDRARQHQRPTNNLLEVWQNLAIFGGRSIGGIVEALLTKVVNRQSSVLLIVVFFVASRRAAVSVIVA
jgi:hypothetical protein